MIPFPDRLLDVPIDQMTRGYIENSEQFACLLCGKSVEKGLIYPDNGLLYEASKYIQVHIEQAHGSVFEALLGLDKRLTGLSDHQSKLLKLFHEGRRDAEVQEALGIGSSSTIRNHRFSLREKERQAKVFLAIMGLLHEQEAKTSAAGNRNPGAKHMEAESGTLLRKLFPDGPEGRLKTFKLKQQQKIVALQVIARRFSPIRTYTEKEINAALSEVYDDPATLRRALIDYGLMERQADGSAYWLKKAAGDAAIGKEEASMDRRKMLNLQYKEEGTEAGVFCIRNKVNGRCFIQGALDLKKMNGKRFELQSDGSPFQELQRDWNHYGEEAFDFEVLEKVDKAKLGDTDIRQAVEAMEAKWLEKLQPYEERGYNKEKRR